MPKLGVIVTDVRIDDLRRRYAQERAKRLRPDGNEQYLELKGQFGRYLEDPYTERVEREPKRDHVTMAFVGGGFAGLVTAARLKDAGVDDVRIVEKGGGFGGTWYWNRYPGAQCDTAAMIYMPLLEETGHMPTELYAHAPEILEHCDRIGKQYGLHDNALFHTEVTDLEWNAGASRWIVRTNRGDEFTAQFIGMGTGPLHVPKLPGIPGIESFAGHSFHTSRWDYAYTGGDPSGAPMDRLAGKRVAIIGTGATAVQCVPHLAQACRELLVFQRTPSSVDARGNRPMDPRWFAEQAAPGWQERWLDNFVANMSAGELPAEDLVNDGWTDLAKRIRGKLSAPRSSPASFEDLLADFEAADHEKMSEIRARVDAIVGDPATGERLKAWYRQLCKRPCFHDEFLGAFNLPSVHLVDTDGQGVERITPAGVVVAGVEYPVDCIIYASGFEVGTEPIRRFGFNLTGRDGSQALGLLVRRDAQHAWRPRARLPERLPGPARPGRQLRGQRAAQPERRGQDRRRDCRPHARAWHAPGRGQPGRRGRLDGATGAQPGHDVVPGRLHSGLLQQRGPGSEPALAAGRVPARGAGLFPVYRGVAHLRGVRRTRVQSQPGGVASRLKRQAVSLPPARRRLL